MKYFWPFEPSTCTRPFERTLTGPFEPLAWTVHRLREMRKMDRDPWHGMRKDMTYSSSRSQRRCYGPTPPLLFFSSSSKTCASMSVRADWGKPIGAKSPMLLMLPTAHYSGFQCKYKWNLLKNSYNKPKLHVETSRFMFYKHIERIVHRISAYITIPSSGLLSLHWNIKKCQQG